MPRLLIFAYLVCTPLLIVLSAYEQFEQPRTLLLVALAAYLTFRYLAGFEGKILRQLKNDLKEAIADPIGLAMLVLLFSATVSTLASISPRTSFFGAQQTNNGLIIQAAFTVLYFACRAQFRAWQQSSLLTASTTLTAIAASAHALVQYFGADPISWSNTLVPRGVLRPPGTVGHPNFLSAYLAMTLPFAALAFMRARQTRQWLGMAAYGATIALSLATIVVAQSRGSWLALVAATLGCFLLTRRQLTRRAGAILLLPTLVLGASFATALALKPDSPLLARSSTLTEFHERIGNLVQLSPARAEYQNSALRIFRRYPILGSGTDTYQLAFQHGRTAKYWIGEWAGAPHRAHNEILNVLATQGAVGLLGYFMLILALGSSAAAVLKRAKDEQRAFALGLAFAILAFYVQNFSSFTVTPTGMLFIVCAAALAAMRGELYKNAASQSDQKDQAWFAMGVPVVGALLGIYVYSLFSPLENSSTLGLVSVVLAVALGLVGLALLPAQAELRKRLLKTSLVGLASAVLISPYLVGRWSASTAMRRATDLAVNAPELALQELQRAIQHDRADDQQVMLAGALAEQLADRATELNTKRAFRDMCIRAYDKCVRLVPMNASYHYALGIALARDLLDKTAAKPEPLRVQTELDRALVLEPNNVIFRAGAAATAIAMGDYGRAWHIGQESLRVYNGFSVFHYQVGFAAFHLRQFLDAAKHFDAALKGKNFTMTTSRAEAEFTENDRAVAEKLLKAARSELGPQKNRR